MDRVYLWKWAGDGEEWIAIYVAATNRGAALAAVFSHLDRYKDEGEHPDVDDIDRHLSGVRDGEWVLAGQEDIPTAICQATGLAFDVEKLTGEYDGRWDFEVRFTADRWAELLVAAQTVLAFRCP